MVKNLPAMWETWVWFLGWEDLLEKGMATHSKTAAWKIPWTEETCGAPWGPWGQKELNTTDRLTLHFHWINSKLSRTWRWCQYCIHTHWEVSPHCFNIIVDIVDIAVFTFPRSRVPWWWLHDLCYKCERYLPSFQLIPTNNFHFCFHCYLLALPSSTSYISAASRHPGLRIKIPYYVLYAVLNSEVHKGATTCRGCTCVAMHAGQVNFVTGHRKASPHFWKFKTWRFIRSGLPIQ